MANWLALAALALQIALSFGHVHLDGIDRAYYGAGASNVFAKTQPQPTPRSGGNDDDYCAVCASIYLVSSSFVPQAPALLVPFVSWPLEHFDRAGVTVVAPRRTPFQSRAPPLG